MAGIKCAAVQYYIKGDDTPYIVTGNSHADCYDALISAGIYSQKRVPGREVEGFIAVTDDTTGETFVDRAEAYIIAKNTGQLKSERFDALLYSYGVTYAVVNT